jgi:signal peptidase I
LPEAPRTTTARFRRWWRSRRVIVHDRSMEPTLLSGDRLYVDPAPARAGTFERGDIVVVRDPEGSVPRLIKRIAALPGDEVGPDRARMPPGYLRVAGDSNEGSRDSSRFGPVAASEVEGVVWFRYAPSERRGPIDRPMLK